MSDTMTAIQETTDIDMSYLDAVDDLATFGDDETGGYDELTADQREALEEEFSHVRINEREIMIAAAANEGYDDVAAYILAQNASIAETERMVKTMGWNPNNWNETESMKRRERGSKRVSQKRVAAALVSQGESPEKARKIAAGLAGDNTDYQAEARAYYAELIAANPAKRERLERSLEWQLSEYETVVARKSAAIWLAVARLAADAKVK